MRKGERIGVVLALLTVLAAVAAPVRAEAPPGPHALFFQANALYRQGDYGQAARLYEELVRRGPVGGGVFYNLGNCWLRMDRVGEAILNYERARVLMPRNPDLLFNLQQARDRRVDEAEPGTGGGRWFLSWASRFTAGEVFLAVAAANALLFSLLTLRLWVRTEWTFYALMAVLLLWAVAVSMGGAAWYAAAHDTRGVVVADRIEVRAGPQEGDTVLFALHAGSVVQCERLEDGWRLVRFGEDKRGWTPAAGVVPVRPLAPAEAGGAP